VTSRLLAAGTSVALAALLLVGTGGTSARKEGGTFRVGMPSSTIIDSIDPILATFPGATPLIQATCAGLLNYPDVSYPAGLRLAPEIATGYPRITNGGKAYTFTIRRGVRFNTGEAVTARSFAHTINRALDPRMDAPFWTSLADIVGARAMHDGNAATVSGVVAHGNTLTVRLIKPAGDFATRVGTLCVVPTQMPINPEGAKAPVPAAGPYYISQYLPGERLVLESNPHYAGTRPHHVDRIVVSIGGDPTNILERVERGELDYGILAPPDYAARAAELVRKYGIDKSRLFSAPTFNLRIFVLNTSRPIFRRNPQLRQAINFAVDRRALVRERGPYSSYPTDQYLPPFMPGFRDERIFPLEGPDLARAQALAKGRTRSGKVVAYVSSTAAGSLAQGQVLAASLARIGLEVEVKAFPSPVLFSRMKTPGEPFDIGWVGWINIPPPPETVLNSMFDGDTIANAPDFGNLSYFDSPKYNRLLGQASRLPLGTARNRAYAALDVDLARNAAPAVAYAYDRALSLVSGRTGCVVVNPYVDLAAVCLK
jgi:peptide/nickel transport system substrate-binding protein